MVKGERSIMKKKNSGHIVRVVQISIFLPPQIGQRRISPEVAIKQPRMALNEILVVRRAKYFSFVCKKNSEN